jgi:TIR domain/Pentapeptide repeats (8 copies)
MADEEQLRILKQGVAAWNTWRKQDGWETGVDLSEANLRGTDLHEATLGGANLQRADLSWANLFEANLSRADLSGANLIVANLSGANLFEANLSRADLRGANLSGAILSEANLNKANLSEANLSEAIFYETTVSNVDLSTSKNIDSVRHDGPSTIDIRTLQRSGSLPLAFLRGVGLPDTLIEYLPSLLGQAIQHYSCFISYSSKDDEFVSRLHADLQDKGVRCWFAPHDMRIGDKIRDTIDDAIRLRDKVLLVLSEASIASDWVEDEVDKAFEEERQRGGLVLFPIRLDETVLETKEAWAAKLRRSRHIGDFRAWKDHDAYQKALERVLRDLKIAASPEADG